MEIVGKTKYQTRGLEGSKVPRTQQALAANEAVKIDRLDNNHRAARGGTAKWVQPVLFSFFFGFCKRVPEPVALSKCQSH